jgi:uncharacterized protein (TIGR02231 family)
LKIESPLAQTFEIACTYLVQNAYWSPLYDLRSDGLDQPLKLVYKADVYNSTGFDWKNVKVTLSSATPLTNNNRPIMSPVFVDFRQIAYYQDMKQDMDLSRARANVYQMKELANSAMAPAVEGVRVSPVGDVVFENPAPEDFLSTFEIDKLQDIASDGKPNTLTVQQSDMAAVYQYHAVPKLEAAVFLLAKVPDFGKYNLLPGTANIFFKDTYVGQTTVNPNITADTLLLSLGRADQVTIKRVQPKDFTERKKMLSNSVKETYAYEIIVKNNKTVPIDIEILDQFPISKQKDIVVEVLDNGGAMVNETYGKLTWRLDIKPGQNKKVVFSYSIKYPKDQTVGLVRG